MQSRHGPLTILVLSIILTNVVLSASNGLNELFKFQIKPPKAGVDDESFMQCTKCPDGSIFQFEHPLPIFGHTVTKITVLRNGFIALDDKSAKSTPTDYPRDTHLNSQRIQQLEGRFLAVFTTVNDGPTGRITIREMNPNASETIGCHNFHQLERIEKFIHYSNPDDHNFVTRSFVSITWENMTNAQDGDSKSNSYTIVLLSNGIKSYALVQYWKIQWPEGNVAYGNSMPPQAGIIMGFNSNYFQLPQSRRSVDSAIWLSESNIASPGEWLIPLYKTSYSRDVPAEKMFDIRREFIFSLKLICAMNLGPAEDNEFLTPLPKLINDAPTTFHNETKEFEGYDYDYTYDYDGLETDDADQDLLFPSQTDAVNYFSAASMGSILHNAEDNRKAPTSKLMDEDETSDSNTEEVIKLVQDHSDVDLTDATEDGNGITEDETETEQIITGKQDKVDENLSTRPDEELKLLVDKAEYLHEVMEPEIVPSTEIPLGLYDGDEDRTLEPSVMPKTYNPLEEDHQTNVEVWSSVSSPVRPPEPRGGEAVYTERCDAARECKVHNADCFLVQAMSCCVCPEKYYGSGNKKCWEESFDYNFALRGNLTTNFHGTGQTNQFPIYLDIQKGRVQRSSSGVRQGSSTDPTYQTIRLFTPMFHVLNSLIAKVCSDRGTTDGVRAYNLFTLAGGLRSTFTIQFFFDIQYVGKITASVKFKLDDSITQGYARGVIDIQLTSTDPINSIHRAYREANEVSGQPDRTYYASYHVDDYGRIVFDENSIDFVAESRGIVESDTEKDRLLVRWSAIGEVPPGEDPSVGCLLQNGGPMVKHHSFYVRMLDRGYCSEDCASSDGSCQLFCVDVPLVINKEPDACSCIECSGEGEICVAQGAAHSCQCAPGLTRMEDRTCRAFTAGAAMCGHVYCHPNARCVDPHSDFCQCLPGYRGDGTSFCESDPCSRCQHNEVCVNDICQSSGVDLCYNVTCGLHAFCQDGSCMCRPGYSGDPRAGCVEEREDHCSRVACHPFASCLDGYCECMPGYEGDGHYECRPVTSDPCHRIQCHRNGYCVDGQCRCREGYHGDGYWDCELSLPDPCAVVQCHQYASCQNGLCLCAPGFVGDGYRDCRPSQNLCHGVQCHQYGICKDGRCECIDSYEGDGYHDCRPVGHDPCHNVKCHEHGHCMVGQCVCHDGYEGDGYWECNPSHGHPPDPCENVRCHSYARCEGGHCRCIENYEGDGVYRCEPTHYDLCHNVQCHEMAYCNQGRCYCRDGYEGDGHHDCRQIVTDPCHHVQCHTMAYCDQGHCFCREGYEGDGHQDCRPIATDNCHNVHCHELAYCSQGHCFCRDGYEGDGHHDCRSIITDHCHNVRCHEMAYCSQGHCICRDGYKGDGHHDCRRIVADSCHNVRCHESAYCSEGRCICHAGYEGDGYLICRHTVQDLCHNVQCHEMAYCSHGQCICRDGYEGDGHHDCRQIVTVPRDPCQDVRCHEMAYCSAGRCYCRVNYVGDGYHECRLNETKPMDPCDNVHCHEMAYCDHGNCFCRDGYEGDGHNDCRQIITDPCHNVHCHEMAYCDHGRCYCREGYEGDGHHDCRLIVADPCAHVHCHQFARCEQGHCRCLEGYVGDGHVNCTRHYVDRCDGVRCAENAFCRDGYCYCSDGFEGDGSHHCRPIEDRCLSLRCHPDAHCYDGYCRCVDGFEGDGIHECRPIDLCANVNCHRLATCYDGRCRCIDGYVGDGYYECRPFIDDPCRHIVCHPNASCFHGRCECDRGFEGDGIRECRPIGPTPSECGRCMGHPYAEMAHCVNGQCVCADGFVQKTPGLCTECVQEDCHRDAKCLQNSEYSWSYSCQCNRGFTGDGVHRCEPDGHVPDPTCGGGCNTPNAECNSHTGRCECRRGYSGDGYSRCVWNCDLCLPEAICDRMSERCSCPPDHHGDGQTYCTPKTIHPSQIKVYIVGQGDVHRLSGLDQALILNCSVTTTNQVLTGQWQQPTGSQEAVVSLTRTISGFDLTLVIRKPTLTDVGRYVCKAGEVEAFIDVAIDDTAVPYEVFLTSDDGILKVKSSGENSTMATLWNLAENNKYSRVSMVTDCKSKRVIYTSDYGHSIRWGDAKASQKDLKTTQIYHSQLNQFRNLAVDPPSGNIFAWDYTNGRLMVMNPEKPQLRYTLNSIESLKKSDPLRFAGMALHSGKGLIYWAAFADSWMPNGTIQVAAMSGEGEMQLIQLMGEPLAISLSPSYDETSQSAGRLCWIQRSITNVFALATEMHCARLSPDGLRVIAQERLRQFSASEEPSWGLEHHRGTVLWTDASKPVYYSANPARRVHVRLVCCSNRFQSISALADCNQAMTNSCGYSNGRCRYFCLPGLSKGSRSCVCPDSDVGCHKEI